MDDPSMMAGGRASASPRLAAAELAAFITQGPLDRDTLDRAIPFVLDTLSVMIAGSVEPGPQRLEAACLPDSGPGAFPLLWSDKSYRADDAALIFGTASHALDFDDVSMITICHPSVPVLCAALCAAPWEDVSGRDFLEAFAIGTEVLIRIGEAMGFRHYALGFHATATLGVFGAAAVSARLMKLDATQTAHALAIAASMASGLRVNFGSMVKSLHVGLAASHGLKASRLAAAGIEGSPGVFENDGFLHAFTGGDLSAWPQDVRLGQPFALGHPGFEQKRYPCCYMLHKAIEATLAIRARMPANMEEIAHIRVDYPRGGTKPLIHPFPKTGLNALFSAPYAVVTALVDGKVDLQSFTDAAVLRPQIQERLADVNVREIGPEFASGTEVGAAPVTVVVTFADGRELSQTISASPGSREDPMTTAQLEQKWLDCLARAAPQADREALRAAYEDGRTLADQASIAPWLDALRATLTGAGR